MKIIWVVIGEVGEYSDFRYWLATSFDNKEDAYNWALKANQHLIDIGAHYDTKYWTVKDLVGESDDLICRTPEGYVENHCLSLDDLKFDDGFYRSFYNLKVYHGAKLSLGARYRIQCISKDRTWNYESDFRNSNSDV